MRDLARIIRRAKDRTLALNPTLGSGRRRKREARMSPQPLTDDEVISPEDEQEITQIESSKEEKERTEDSDCVGTPQNRSGQYSRVGKGPKRRKPGS